MSGIIRFISDPHFGHKNMAERRGFPDVVSHDEYIISQWNSIVSKNDTTWILGDITMEKNDYSILDRLKGYKKVILGNHDRPQHAQHILKYVNSMAGIVKIKSREYGNIWLTHCPVHPSELEHRVNLNIHGHVHGNSLEDSRYINVCMEVQDYTPKTIDELIKLKKDENK